MDPIRNAKKVLQDIEKNLEQEQQLSEKSFRKFEKEFDALLESIPDEDILNHEDGLMVFAALNEGIDIIGGIGKAFSGASKAYAALKLGTQSAANTVVHQTEKFNDFRLNRKQKKLVNNVTKDVVDAFYVKYATILNQHKKQGTVFSKGFFNDLIDILRLEPDVEKNVRTEFKPVIEKFVNKLKAESKPKREQLIKDKKLSRSNSVQKSFSVLGKRERYPFEVKGNELVGKIIGYAATATVADYFKNNPGEAFDKEVKEDINGHEYIDKNEILALAESKRTEYENNSIYGKYYKGENEDV